MVVMRVVLGSELCREVVRVFVVIDFLLSVVVVGFCEVVVDVVVGFVVVVVVLSVSHLDPEHSRYCRHILQVNFWIRS